MFQRCLFVFFVLSCLDSFVKSTPKPLSEFDEGAVLLPDNLYIEESSNSPKTPNVSNSSNNGEKLSNTSEKKAESVNGGSNINLNSESENKTIKSKDIPQDNKSASPQAEGETLEAEEDTIKKSQLKKLPVEVISVPPGLNKAENVNTKTDIQEIVTEVSPTNNTIIDSESQYIETGKQVVISYGCPVDNMLPCVSKCCDIDQSHANFSTSRLNRTECVARSKGVDFWVDFKDCPDYGMNGSVDVQYRYEYFIGIPCTDGKYVLDPSAYPEDAYSLFSNGSLLYASKLFTMADYCVDNVDNEFKVFVCFDSVPPTEIEFYHILYPVGQIISVLFLLGTAAVYLGVEQFRDLQGKSLVCHVSCLAVAFSFLATVQLTGSNTDPNFCVVAAFIIQFSFVACFFWLNVLSYDTYRNIRENFRDPRSGRMKDQPTSERKQFILYSIYAWNGPLILFVVSLVLDNVPGIPDTLLKPNFGVQSCWFSSETAALPYFFGPVGMLLSINIIFFALSAFHVFKKHKEAHMEELARSMTEEDPDQKKIKKLRRKMRPYTKALKQCFALFLIMGMSWIAEIASWAIGGSKYVWVTTDIINTLQGVLIFGVFVLKPLPQRTTVRKLLSKWFGVITHCDASYKAVPTHNHHTAEQINLPTIDNSRLSDNHQPEMTTFR